MEAESALCDLALCFRMALFAIADEAIEDPLRRWAQSSTESVIF